jgi:outer membrane protein OmpA-like peptidoglycan-associated protein
MERSGLFMRLIKCALPVLVGLALAGCAISNVDDRAQPPSTVEGAAKSNTFEVFFDPDSPDISQSVAKILREVADKAKEIRASRITLSVHSTAAGWDAYSEDLSERRAAAIKAELVMDGVSVGKISYVDVGRVALEPTPDGVREPRNRRTEITLY